MARTIFTLYSRPSRSMAKSSLTREQSLWLLATAGTTVLPLAPHLPTWLSATSAAALVWRVWQAWHDRPLPPRWLPLLLALVGCTAVVVQFRTLFGQNAGVALLMLFMALKQMEAKTTRDGLAVIFLAYFLAMAQFFYSQTIPAALTTAVGTITATAALASLADARVPVLPQLRLALRMLAQALPLMLILFVLFPRVQGPLWGLPNDAHSGLTGLSNTMTPGSISELSQSDAVAFRVRFDGPEPKRQQLYWRGPVLTEFDGTTWRPADNVPRGDLPYDVSGQGGIDYEVTLEAHGKGWLFALELPGRIPDNALATREALLLAKAPVTARQRYPMRSHPDLTLGPDESPAVLRGALALPVASNPRTRTVAAEWRQQAGSDEEILHLAQRFFLRRNLMYTLTPPLLGKHSADEFLFDTRQGFCEHFASAFAIALRAAGVPARVVTGYQGGETNPVDGYMTVRQYDAHAWTEVWLRERGWVRVDPTAISAPTRIDLNLAAAVPGSGALPLLMRGDYSWLRSLRYRLDAIANAWNQWVLGYNPERQLELMRRLGMREPDWRQMGAMLAALSGLSLLALTAWNLRSRQRFDPATRQWRRACRRLARRGLPRQPAEGPLDYALRIGKALPKQSRAIHEIATAYAELRYGRPAADHPDRIIALRRLVTAFRP